ncbi:hypothetical protein SpCBS45565_g05756 [Spizellomyces sp. 'palustris']|nr:hypothetical protein SpCBS45565_g05756 [Spizellomyces sp. 'palustris']
MEAAGQNLGTTGPLPTELWIAIVSHISSPTILWHIRSVNTVFRHIALVAIYSAYTGTNAVPLSDSEREDSATASLKRKFERGPGRPRLSLSFSLPSPACSPEPATYLLSPRLPPALNSFIKSGILPDLHFLPDAPYEEYAAIEGFRGFAALVVKTAKKIQRDVATLEDECSDEESTVDEWSKFTGWHKQNTSAPREGDVISKEQQPQHSTRAPGQIKNHLKVVAAFLKMGRADLTGQHMPRFSTHLRFSYDLLLGHILSTYDRICQHSYVRAEPQLSLLALTWRVIEVIAPSTHTRDLRICNNRACCKGALKIGFHHTLWSQCCKPLHETQEDAIDHPYSTIVYLNSAERQSVSSPSTDRYFETLWDGTYGKVVLTTERLHLSRAHPPAYLELSYLSHSDSDHASLVTVEVVASPMWLLKGQILEGTSGIEEAIKRMEKAMEKAVEALEMVGSAFGRRAGE